MLFNRRAVSGLSLVLALGVAQSAALGQCGPRWVKDPVFSSIGAEFKSRSVSAMVTWDPDGAGPERPRLVAAVRATLADNTTWTRIYEWLDAAWSSLPSPPKDFIVRNFAAMPDGRLYIGGWDGTSGPTRLNHLAQLVNGAWVDAGGGVSGKLVFRPDAGTLLPLADGRLLVAGEFTTAGTTPANGIAIWDGTAWTPLGSGVNDLVLSAAELPDGDIIIGGLFNRAGGVVTNAVARYRSGQWSAISGPKFPSAVSKVLARNQGDFVIGGPFRSLGTATVNGVGGFDGTNWFGFGNGLISNALPTDYYALTDMLASNAGDLIVGGQFRNSPSSSQIPSWLARWDGTAWRAIDGGVDGNVWRLANMPDGSVAVSGGFTTVDGMPVNGLARFTYAPCPADFNNDCFLSFEDADAMIDAFVDGDPGADFDADGMLTWADVDAFIAAFEDGC